MYRAGTRWHKYGDTSGNTIDVCDDLNRYPY